MFRTNAISEEEVYGVLANGRRRETIRHLTEASGGDAIALADLATAIATRETGESPPPRPARESVYNSLHQTHLPKLEELDVVRYDREAKEVQLRDRAREVELYMELVTVFGVTWSEAYRTLGVGSLVIVVAALADAPGIGAVDPLLWASGFLLVYAVAISFQLWSNRWYVVRALRR